MGTRSLVVFQDEGGEEICVVYRQYDGHPESRGRELVDFLRFRVLAKGLGDVWVKQSNGMGDCVAQWIAYEKSAHGTGDYLIGKVYIHPPNTRDVDEEYIYTVKGDGNGGFDLTCWDVYDEKFVEVDV